MNEGVLSFIGVIIGGLIGIVGTLTANYYQNENNRTIYLLDKRREVYLSIIKMYLKINLNYDNAESIEIIDKFQELSPEVFLLGSNKVKNELEKVKDCLLEYKISLKEKDKETMEKYRNLTTEFSLLAELMRKELGIRD